MSTDPKPHLPAPELKSMRMEIPSSQVVQSAGVFSLLGGHCTHCGQLNFPVHAVCPNCASDAQASAPLPDRGILYAFSRVHIAGAGVRVPYVIGYVDLKATLRLFAGIDAEFEALTINQPLQLRITPAKTPGRFVYAFAPLSEHVV